MPKAPKIAPKSVRIAARNVAEDRAEAAEQHRDHGADRSGRENHRDRQQPGCRAQIIAEHRRERIAVAHGIFRCVIGGVELSHAVVEAPAINRANKSRTSAQRTALCESTSAASSAMKSSVAASMTR